MCHAWLEFCTATRSTLSVVTAKRILSNLNFILNNVIGLGCYTSFSAIYHTFHLIMFKHENTLQTPQNFLTFSNLPNRSHWYHFYKKFWGCGRVRSDFAKSFEEFIRQKLRFSQFWTFMPILSTLLEHFKISIMPPKNDWKVVYYIKRVENITLKAIWSLQIDDNRV